MARGFVLGSKGVAAVALLAAIGSGDALAASCKQADLKGEWIVELSTESACLLRIDKSGSFKNGPCKPQGGGSAQGTASGKLSVDAKCKVTGQMEFKQKSGPKLKISVGGRMNKGKDLISGTATSQFGSATFKAFLQ